MSDEEIIEKLKEFADHLHIGTIMSDVVRWLGWIFIKGISYILDGIENITDDILFIKSFYNHKEVTSFVDSIRPLLVILLAFSILYAGYLMIFQKKFNREGMAINIFLALVIIALLSTGMSKADSFTNDAIDAIDSQQLYEEEEGTISQNILSRNIVDLMEFDDLEWEETELDKPNQIPLNLIDKISITEKLDSKDKDLELSKNGEKISEHQTFVMDGEQELKELPQGKLDLIKEHYYRYDINWIATLTTLIVMAFTLLTIAYKLARLSFEMTFNYVLAHIIAPIDVHDGQKTKKIITSIFNTFVTIILIFLSMKIYIIGTGWISDSLSGIAYLIALIAFSVAVIDGPNIVEKLFGVDAGLKSGVGMLAVGWGGAKIASNLTKGMTPTPKPKTPQNKSKQGEKQEGNKGGKGNKKSPKSQSSPSLNADNNKNQDNDSQNKQNKKSDKDKGNQNEKDNPNSKENKNSETGIDSTDKQKRKGSSKNGKILTPSPNASEREGNKTSQNDGDTKGVSSNVPSPNDEERQQQGKHRVNNHSSVGTGGSPSPQSGKPQGNTGGTTGTGTTQRQTRSMTQKDQIEVDTEVDRVVEERQGVEKVNEYKGSSNVKKPKTDTTRKRPSSYSIPSRKSYKKGKK